MIVYERYRYPLHVWLTSLFLVAPVLYAVYEAVSQRHNYHMMLYSLFIWNYLLPTFGVVALLYGYLRKCSLDLWLMIVLMNTAGIASILLTMALIRSSSQMLQPAVIYSLSMVISSILIKWKKS